MKEWILFICFALVGIGMFAAGLFDMLKEKDDPESVKIYRIVCAIGTLLTIAAILFKFVF